MREMHCYNNNGKDVVNNTVTISEAYYKQLLKYKDNYHALCNDLTSFYEIDAKGCVVGVDAYELAEHFRTLVQHIVGN